MAQRIKFHASFPEPERYGLMKVTEVVFTLGKGPCGRWVTNLTYEVQESFLKITQTSYPDDFESIRRTAKRLFEDVVSDAKRIEKHGYGDLKTMTPTKDRHERKWERLRSVNARHHELHDQVEIKEFVYKLTDIHGRIEALK